MFVVGVAAWITAVACVVFGRDRHRPRVRPVVRDFDGDGPRERTEFPRAGRAGRLAGAAAALVGVAAFVLSVR
ncbi:hypothetical protein [Embleya scabrispora]|uniref:hypothetical protein n=1 Tax=Embleya scabrispora TaxID=159449 RepID=UPI00037AE8B6|nr:hypothetical protein [Embleya scabrispora]MYS80308.1 hypothetical protein [Streptomyces sp. SID5474]